MYIYIYIYVTHTHTHTHTHRFLLPSTQFTPMGTWEHLAKQRYHNQEIGVDGIHLFRFFQFYAHSFVFVYVYVFVCACVYVCMCVQLYEVFYHRCRFM
jgi:hypothetical protein